MTYSKRQELGQEILNLVAGYDLNTVLTAQCDALATSVGAAFHLSGKTCDEAEAVIRELAEDMATNHIRRHWGKIELGSIQ